MGIHLKYFGVDLLDLLFPRKCLVCGRVLELTERVLCTSCYINVPFIQFPSVEHNYLTDIMEDHVHIERAASLMYYRKGSPYTRLLTSNKYGGWQNVGRRVGMWAARYFLDSGLFEGVDMLIPVPLSAKRLRRRGYNQCLPICKGLHRVARIPIVTDQLLRVGKENGSQVGKSAEERKRGKKFGDFAVRDPESLRGKHVMVVDDVFTTGTTMRACLLALHEAVPSARVSFFTIAYAGSRVVPYERSEETIDYDYGVEFLGGKIAPLSSTDEETEACDRLDEDEYAEDDDGIRR